MSIFCDIIPNEFHSDNSTYIVVLLIALLVLFSLVYFLWQQRKDRERMERELAHLAAVEGLDVEYELIIQAMKLATWRVDLNTMEIIFDNDYREEQGLFTPNPGMRMMQVYEMIHPDDRKKVKSAITDLANGKADMVN